MGPLDALLRRFLDRSYIENLSLTGNPTGRTGTAFDVEPEADTELISCFVRESARALLSA